MCTSTLWRAFASKSILFRFILFRTITNVEWDLPNSISSFLEIALSSFFSACYSECKTFYAFFLENFILTLLLFSRIQTKNWSKGRDCSTKTKSYKKAVTLLCQCHQARNIKSYQNEIIINTSSVRAFTVKYSKELSRDQSNSFTRVSYNQILYVIMHPISKLKYTHVRYGRVFIENNGNMRFSWFSIFLFCINLPWNLYQKIKFANLYSWQNICQNQNWFLK